MGEWKEYKLYDLIKIVGGGTPKTNIEEYWSGEIPWISVVDFNTGKKYIYNTEKHISIVGLQNSSTKILRSDDIIISARGTVGVIAMLAKDMAFNQSCYGISGIPNLTDNEFIYYLLKDTVDNFLQISHGGVFDTITRDTFKEIEVLVPPLSEQKAIASVLSSLDDKIDLLHRQNKTLEAMAETLFRQWFIEEADDSWEEKKLDKLLTISSSKRIFYKEYVSYGIPFYRSKEIIELSKNGSTNSELFITFERFEEINEKFGVPQNGDILLTSVGTLGVPYQVRGNTNFYFKDGNLTWFKNFKGISSNIIYCWLKSRIGQDCLESITIGSTQVALTISGLKNITLKLPPSNLLKELDLQLSLIYDKINTNQKQIQSLENLRDSLLPKLMSGEVRVKY